MPLIAIASVGFECHGGMDDYNKLLTLELHHPKKYVFALSLKFYAFVCLHTLSVYIKTNVYFFGLNRPFLSV